MSLGLSALVCTRLAQRYLASPPAIWGKLPSQGDYAHFNTSAQARRDWQDWVAQHWREPRLAAAAQRAQPGLPLISAGLPAPKRDPFKVPVAFVLPPGTLPFSPKRYVLGVMVKSVDQVGRAYPLIIYQEATPAWIKALWQALPAHAVRDAKMQAGHSLLFWWARIAARSGHGADLQWLARAVLNVWQAHAPGWRQLFGCVAATPDQSALRTLLEDYCAQADDAAAGLSGVRHLPWADWPHRLLRQKPAAAFWQQDLHGGFVNAAESWPRLWTTRP